MADAVVTTLADVSGVEIEELTLGGIAASQVKVLALAPSDAETEGPGELISAVTALDTLPLLGWYMFSQAE